MNLEWLYELRFISWCPSLLTRDFVAPPGGHLHRGARRVFAWASEIGEICEICGWFLAVPGRAQTALRLVFRASRIGPMTIA